MPEGDRRRILLIELLVVLALFVLPSLANGLRAYLYPLPRPTLTYSGAALARIVSFVSLLPAVVFIAWRSGDSLSRFGVRGFRWWSGALWIALTVGVSIGITNGVNDLALTWLPDLNRASVTQQLSVRQLPKTGLDYCLMVVTFALGSATEEFVMRGYLIARLQELFRSTTLAVFVASVLFASYHIYQGPIATITVLLLGALFSGLLLVTKSIWPGTITHAIYNILGHTINR
jgi:membrane protease YdiL (CAAX protease family)